MNRRFWAAAACAAAFAVLCAALWPLHPLAPLVPAASLLVQAPIVLLLTGRGLSSGYLRRAAERRALYAQSGDAAAWLAQETAETKSAGYRYWSAAGRAQCALNRAEAAAALRMWDEAARCLAQAEALRLPEGETRRFEQIALDIRLAGDSVSVLEDEDGL